MYETFKNIYLKESPHLHCVDYDETDENEKTWHSKHPFLSLFFLELSLYKGKKLVVFSVASEMPRRVACKCVLSNF